MSEPPVTRTASRPLISAAANARILVVDDQESVRTLVERVLTRAGYQVVSAASGSEAVRLGGERGPFDLLLSDIVMPDFEGPLLAERLRTTQLGLKVLFMSGYGAAQPPTSVADGSILAKPFDADFLLRCVSTVLGVRLPQRLLPGSQ